MCRPTLNAEVFKLAAPDETAPVPSVVAPSLKITVPVGEPAIAATLTVKVTDWPNVLEVGTAVSVVVVVATLTVCVIAVDALEPKFKLLGRQVVIREVRAELLDGAFVVYFE